MQGSMELWNLTVPVSALIITKNLLNKADYDDSHVCMERIVPWSSLAGTSVARGHVTPPPPKTDSNPKTKN